MTGIPTNHPSPFPVFPEVDTARCHLVQPTLDHAPALLEIFGDEETMRYMQSPTARTIEDCQARIKGWQHEYESGRNFHWAILPKNDPAQLIGIFALHYWSKARRSIEMGSYLHRRVWGCGFSTEVTREMIGFAFSQLDINRLELRCDPRNAASAIIAGKFGMRQEGVLREYAFVEGKGFVDEAVYSLLRKDLPDPYAL